MVHMVSHGAFHMVTILLRSIIFMDEIGQFGYLVVRQKISSKSEVFFMTMLMFFVTMLMFMFLAVQNSSMGDRVTHSLTESVGQ